MKSQKFAQLCGTPWMHRPLSYEIQELFHTPWHGLAVEAFVQCTSKIIPICVA